MLPFLAMLFTLRVGLAAGPPPRADSLREQAVAVGAEQGVVRQATREVASTPPRAGDALASREAPPRRALTRDDWLNLFQQTLANETVANAAIWIASQPVHVSMSGQKLFVSVRFATP